MSPVVLEAVYERVPADRRASAVRFGVRARLGREDERISASSGKIRGPREALPVPAIQTAATLVYGPQGQVVPLLAVPPLAPFRGAHLDVFG